MKAMILAAGVGQRMRPLTLTTPKPLLEVNGMPLVERQIRRLAAVGLRELVINVSWLADRIQDYCGDGARWGVAIEWSREAEPLETAGGIVQALPVLGTDPFLLVSCDIWTDYPLERLVAVAAEMTVDAHLVLVDNPSHHPLGDFLLRHGRPELRSGQAPGLTYAGIGVYSPQLFRNVPPGRKALRPLLEDAIARDALSAEHYTGNWSDVGTPERLAALNRLPPEDRS